MFYEEIRIKQVLPSYHSVGDSNKYPKHMLLEILMQYSCIISHLLSPLERRFRDFQIVIITNFIVVSSLGIKRVDYI